MQFKSLRIERKEYGPFEGQNVGEATFAGAFGTLGVMLTPELAARVLLVCADALVNVSREAATLMTHDIINQLPSPAGTPSREALMKQSGVGHD